MVQINFALKEVNCKIVFYGPGMSGKTTNLEIVHQKAPEENKGELTSISTDGDRTLFFDFMPLDLGNVAGMRTKFQLYTVPGQVYYNSTRKLVLQGVDGVIFVADSDGDKMAENIESYENLIENLAEYGKDIRELPHVIQYNKRDHPNALPVDELDRQMNRFGVPTFQAVAVTGEGVFPTLKVLAGMVLESIDRMDDRRPRNRPAAPQAAAVGAAPAGEPGAARGPQGGARPGGRGPAGRGAAPAGGGGAPQQRRRGGPPAGGPGARGPNPRSASQRPSPSRVASNAARRRGPAGGRGPEPQGAERPSGGGRKMVMIAVMTTVFLAAAAAGVVFFLQNQQG